MVPSTKADDAQDILRTHAVTVAETMSQKTKTKMKMKKWSGKSPVDTYTCRTNRMGCHSLVAVTEEDSDTLLLQLVAEEEDEDQKLAMKLQKPQPDKNDLNEGEL